MNKYKTAISDWHNMVTGGMSETAFLNKHEQTIFDALQIASEVENGD